MQKFIFRKNKCIKCDRVPIGTWYRDKDGGYLFQVRCPVCGSRCWTWCRIRRQREWAKAVTVKKWNRINVPGSDWYLTSSGRAMRKRTARVEHED
nr:MAG TPA: restriction alleviation protein [Caudoviricetes sp.]